MTAPRLDDPVQSPTQPAKTLAPRPDRFDRALTPSRTINPTKTREEEEYERKQEEIMREHLRRAPSPAHDDLLRPAHHVRAISPARSLLPDMRSLPEPKIHKIGGDSHDSQERVIPPPDRAKQTLPNQSPQTIPVPDRAQRAASPFSGRTTLNPQTTFEELRRSLSPAPEPRGPPTQYSAKTTVQQHQTSSMQQQQSSHKVDEQDKTVDP